MTTLPEFPSPTWFAGCGNMAGAMVAGWRSVGMSLDEAVAIRPSGTLVEGVRTVTKAADAGSPPRLIILGMKPQSLDAAVAELAPWVTSRTLIVSILAGVELETLKDRFPRARAIVRAMPNLPVAIRRGVIALHTDTIDATIRNEIAQLFAVLGMVVWAPDEARFSAIGSVSGAGPAYVARFIDALTKAGVERGLSRETAETVALETVLGTSWLAASTRESMDTLAGRVASPNGTTEAGLAVLDREAALDKLIARTVAEAARRGSELAETAKAAPSLADAPTLH